LSKSVFISHALKDKALVQEIVNLIEEGMGVPEDEIFCSSLDGYGIPSGKNFVTYIKEQLLEPKVVVLVLTPAYFESKFCLSELGAAWIKSHNIFPILVPPLQYSDVKDVLLGTQVAKVDDDIKYNELLSTLTAALDFKPKSQTKWDTKRRAFLKTIAPILKKVAGPTVVSVADFKAKSDHLAEALVELDASEAEIRRLKERLAATEALKDKREVAKLRAEYSDSDLSERFNTLTDEIKEFRSALKSDNVMKFVLCDHYDKPYTISWYEDREEFETAARFGFVDVEEGERVVWSKRQMKELKKKLDELDSFISEHKKALQASVGDEIPLEPDAQDFWEYHYDI
jgi:TIR domain